MSCVFYVIIADKDTEIFEKRFHFTLKRAGGLKFNRKFKVSLGDMPADRFTAQHLPGTAACTAGPWPYLAAAHKKAAHILKGYGLPTGIYA